MKRFAINYARKVPDHRTYGDYTLIQAIQSSPFQKFKIWRAGATSNLSKYFQVYVSYGIFAIWLAIGLYKFSSVTQEDLFSKKGFHKTALKWGVFSEKKEIGRFDNIHNRFENEQHGRRDWAR